MEQIELTKNTPTEYRAIAKTGYHHDTSRGWRIHFDIYGGPGRGRNNDVLADCHIAVEGWKMPEAKRTTYVSGELNLSEMMELYAILGEAIERAQKALKAAA